MPRALKYYIFYLWQTLVKGSIEALPRNHFNRGVDTLAVAVGCVAEALHGVRARAAVRPQAEPDGALALEGPVGVGADAALAGAAAALVDVDAVAPVAGKFVARIANTPKGEKSKATKQLGLILKSGGLDLQVLESRGHK